MAWSSDVSGRVACYRGLFSRSAGQSAGRVISQEFVGELLPPSYLYKRAEICVLVQFDLQPFLSFGKSPNILRVEVAEVSCSGQENVADSAQQAAFLSPSNEEEI